MGSGFARLILGDAEDAQGQARGEAQVREGNGVKKKIWLSEKILKKQPVLAKIIKGCVALEASRFKLIETEASFLHSKASANRAKGSRMVLGMVATKEKATKGNNYNTSSEVLSFIENIDPLKNSMGMSGR